MPTNNDDPSSHFSKKLSEPQKRLYVAINNNDYNLVLSALKDGVTPNFQYDSVIIKSPLQLAVVFADYKIVKLLIAAGALISDIDEKTLIKVALIGNLKVLHEIFKHETIYAKAQTISDTILARLNNLEIKTTLEEIKLGKFEGSEDTLDESQLQQLITKEGLLQKSRNYSKSQFNKNLVFVSDIPEHINSLFEKEKLKLNTSKTLQLITELRHKNYAEQVVVKFDKNYNLQIKILCDGKSTEITAIKLVVDGEGFVFDHPWLGQIKFTLNANAQLCISNVAAQKPVLIESAVDVTLDNCKFNADLLCSSEANLQVTNDFTAEGYVGLESKNNSIQITSKINSKKTIAVAAPEVKFADEASLSSAQSIFVHAASNFAQNSATLSAVGMLQICSPKQISYNLSNIICSNLIALVVPNAADMQLVDRNLSYCVASEERQEITIEQDKTFSKNLQIFAPFCTLKVGTEAHAADVLVQNKAKLYLYDLQINHGGIYAKSALEIACMTKCRSGKYDLSQKIAFGAGNILKNNSTYIGSDHFVSLQAVESIGLDNTMLQVIDGYAVFRTPTMLQQAGKVVVVKDCIVDSSDAQINILHRTVQPNEAILKQDAGLATVEAIQNKVVKDIKQNLKHMLLGKLQDSGTKKPVKGRPIVENHDTIQTGLQILSPAPEFFVYGILHTNPKAVLKSKGASIYFDAHIGALPPQNEDISQHLIHSRRTRFLFDLSNPTTIPATDVISARGFVQSSTDLEQVSNAETHIVNGRLMSAGTITSTVKDMQVGTAEFNYALSNQQIECIETVFYDPRTFGLYKKAEGAAAAIFSVPKFAMPRLDLPQYPAVIVANAQITVDFSESQKRHKDATDELLQLFPFLTNKINTAVLSGIGSNPLQAWNILHENAQLWIAANPQFRDRVSESDIKQHDKPMFLYVPRGAIADGVIENVLMLQLYLPEAVKQRLQQYASDGIFANELITNGRNLSIYGTFSAVNANKIKLTGAFANVRRSKTTERIVEDTLTTSKFLSTKTKKKSKKAIEKFVDPNSGVTSGGSVDLTAKSAFNSGGISATKTDLKVEVQDDFETTAIHATQYSEFSASGKSKATKRAKFGVVAVNIHEHKPQHTIIPATISAKGKIEITSHEANVKDTGTQFSAESEKITANVEIESNTYKVPLELPTKITTVNGTTTVSNMFMESGIPSQHVVKNELKHSAGKEAKYTGTQFFANKISLSAQQGIRILPQVLNNFIESTTIGFSNPFTYIDSKTQSKIQSALQPVLAGFTLLEVESNGQIEFQSPSVYGEEHSKFIAKAHADSVKFTTVKLESSSTTTIKTLGVTFNGSQAIAASIDKKTGEALRQLMKQIPLFAPVVTMGAGGHSEDMMAQAMLLSFTAFNAFKNGAMANMGNFSDYVLSQFGLSNNGGKMEFDAKSLNISIRAGHTVRKEEGMNVVSSMISVWDMVFQAARDVDLHSVHIEGKNLTINAGGSTHIVADAETQSMDEKGFGASVGYGTSGYNAGVDANMSKFASKKYKSSTIKVAESFNVTTGENLEVRGALIETAIAFISAKNLLVETLLDEEHSKSMSASANTDGNVSANFSKKDSKWADIQAGIHASETMYIDVKEKQVLKGGVLAVGENKKPLLTENDAKLFELVMPGDGDDLFHAMGVSRLKAADDLLKNSGNVEIRSMVSNDIARMLKAGQLPKIIAEHPTAKTLFAEFKALPENTTDEALEEKILEFARTEAVFKEFVAFFVALAGSNLTFNPAVFDQPNTIDAIAKLNNIALKVWIKGADDKLMLKHNYQTSPDDFEVNLFANINDVKNANRQHFNLLSTDPMLVICPVITHEHVYGYKKSVGFGVTASGMYNAPAPGKFGSNNYVIPTMHRSNQKQINKASITGQAKVINRQGLAHDLSGIETGDETQFDGKKHRFGVGFVAPVGGFAAPKDNKKHDKPKSKLDEVMSEGLGGKSEYKKSSLNYQHETSGDGASSTATASSKKVKQKQKQQQKQQKLVQGAKSSTKQTSKPNDFIRKQSQNLYSAYDTDGINVGHAVEFGLGAAEGVFVNTLIFQATKVKYLGTVVKGFGWLGVGVMIVKANEMVADFETDNFMFTEDFDNIMANPFISAERKHTIWNEAEERQRIARAEASQQKSLWQNFKDDPKIFGFNVGMFFGYERVPGLAANAFLSLRPRNPFKAVPEKRHVEYLDNVTKATPGVEHVVIESSGANAYENFANARELGRINANLGDDAIPYLSTLGPHKGNVYVGMQSPDGSRLWRLDLNTKVPKGQDPIPHINWQYRDPKTGEVYYGSIIINMSHTKYLEIINQFPRKLPFIGE